MLTILLAVACALLVATALTFALRARHWRRQADSLKGTAMIGADVSGAQRARLRAVEDMADRFDDLADGHGLTPNDARVFAMRLRQIARGGEQP